MPSDQNLADAVVSINTADATISQLQIDKNNLQTTATQQQTTINEMQDNVNKLQETVDKLQKSQSSSAPSGLPSIFVPTMIGNLERASGWKFATDHVIDAAHPHSNGTITPQSDGWTDFVITPAMDYDNTYYYRELGTQPQATRFAWAATVSVADSEIPKCQAWEWEFEQTINGRFFNMGWQCLFSKADGGPAWRYFDKVNHHWKPSGIPLDLSIFKGGTPVTVLAEYHKPDADHIQFDALTINGQRNALTNIINLPEDQTVKDPNKAKVNFLHYAFQQDPVKSQGWKIRVKAMTAFYL